jgi:hypothetical protein
VEKLPTDTVVVKKGKVTPKTGLRGLDGSRRLRLLDF